MKSAFKEGNGEPAFRFQQTYQTMMWLNSFLIKCTPWESSTAVASSLSTISVVLLIRQGSWSVNPLSFSKFSPPILTQGEIYFSVQDINSTSNECGFSSPSKRHPASSNHFLNVSVMILHADSGQSNFASTGHLLFSLKPLLFFTGVNSDRGTIRQPIFSE